MILVTGANSRLGRCVVHLLLDRGESVRCFIRQPNSKNRLRRSEVEIFYGDLENESAVEKALADVSTLINIAPIGLARVVVQACRGRGVTRAIFISSTRLYSEFQDDVVRQIREGEEIIKNSGLDYTIIRPSMMYSDEEDRNIGILLKLVGALPIVPIFGSGKNLVQPVFVWDVARAIIEALNKDVSIKNEYTVAGPEPMQYAQMIKEIIRVMGKKKMLMKLPFWLGKMSAGILQHFSSRPFITVEQIERLREDRSFDITQARHDLAFMPIPFSEGLSLRFHQKSSH